MDFVVLISHSPQPSRKSIRGDFLQSRVFFSKSAQNLATRPSRKKCCAAILVLKVCQNLRRKITEFYWIFGCVTRGAGISIIGGGGGGADIHIYSCSAQLIYFEIDCFYSLCTRIYMVAPMCNTQKKILVHKQELKSTNKIFNTQFEV